MNWTTHFTQMMDDAAELMYGGYLMDATEAMQRALIGPAPVTPPIATVSPQVLDAVLPLRRTAAPQAKAAHTVVGAGTAAVTALRTSEPPDSFERIQLQVCFLDSR